MGIARLELAPELFPSSKPGSMLNNVPVNFSSVYAEFKLLFAHQAGQLSLVIRPAQKDLFTFSRIFGRPGY
jgi:hypothetical protein